ncbi:MAG TPA: GldG family protein [Candidatus Eisenbacteria bacterium]|nr:GldG family protein [Candidatus Eisenbacteria bacterium]
MNMQLLRARQTKYVLYLTLYVLVTLAVIVIANILADRYDRSFDSTANKRYSLSPQTAKIVKDLKQPVTITYFDQATKFEGAKDLLGEYANLSPKVHIAYVDPDKKPELAKAANISSYGTAVVQIGDRKEPAQSFTEEGITGAFIRDLKISKRTVCFVEGSGEHRIEETSRSGFSHLKDLLGKDEYESQSIDLVVKAEVPSDCTVLVVGGPISDYQQPEVDAIQKYVENGGRALFLLDPPLKMGRAEVADNAALNKMLEAWGVTPQANLIIDLNPIGQIAGLGPQVALVTSYDPQPIVNELKGNVTGFPLARSLEIKNGDKTSVDKLFSSSETSLATTNLSNPAIDPKDPRNTKGPLLIAAAGTYKTGKDNSQGRFVVVGSSSWAANSFLGFNGNRDLALNTINWLASDEDLISIRPKERDDRRITLTRAQMTWIRISSQFLLPLLVVFGGVSVWWRRR